MQAYLVSRQSTIVKAAYDFDHLGNLVCRDLQAFLQADLPLPGTEEKLDENYGYELAVQLSDAGWVDLDECVGNADLVVKVNMQTFQTFTFCKGEAALVNCSNASNFATRLAYERQFYKLKNPPFTLIDGESGPVLYDHSNKSFMI